MQTNTARGMQTMEQALADLAVRRIVNVEDAISRSSRPDQLIGILERSGMVVEFQTQNGGQAGQSTNAIRTAS
jgi:Tfp pilus assembly ATPase PilU